jgi:hypothetical protein
VKEALACAASGLGPQEHPEMLGGLRVAFSATGILLAALHASLIRENV